MRLNPRKRLMIDTKVQGALILRMLLYWFFCVVVVGQILLCLDVINGPVGAMFNQFRFESLWAQYGAVVIASVLILPVLLADTVLTSNRFAGPLYRMRRSMRALIAGEPVKPIKLRKKDFLLEMAKEFNDVLAYVEQLKRQAESHAASTPSRCENENSLEPQAVH